MEDDKGRTVRQPCCDAWAKAHEWGTDNEGHLALIYYRDDKPRIGSDLPPVQFCPWCGTKKG